MENAAIYQSKRKMLPNSRTHLFRFHTVICECANAVDGEVTGVFTEHCGCGKTIKKLP